MKKIFVLDDVMVSKLRMRNLVFFQRCCWRFKYYGMLCCVLLDPGDSSIMGCCVLLDPGDSSIMGCYVVYCLILEIQVLWDVMLCTA
jgi:hypothetical protein